MRKYSVVSTQFAQSATTLTNVIPIGLLTGSGRSCQVYELILGCGTASVDTLSIFQLNGTSVVLTAGTGITATPLESGNSAPAAVTTASSAPTGFSVSPANPYLNISVNGRVTARWLAADPDSRIIMPAGGGAAGSLALTSKQVGTTSYNVETNLYFAE